MIQSSFWSVLALGASGPKLTGLIGARSCCSPKSEAERQGTPLSARKNVGRAKAQSAVPAL
jgi:hypothetical protein